MRQGTQTSGPAVANDRNGRAIRVGDFVQYHGSPACLRGQETTR